MRNSRTTQAATSQNAPMANSASSAAQNQGQPSPATTQQQEQTGPLASPLALVDWQTRYLQTCASDPEAQQVLFGTLDLLRQFNDHMDYPDAVADYSAQCVNRHTGQIEQELGIDWRITAKTARKTFGCLMLAAGHRIADVSLMLGHSTIATTERHYVKVRAASIDRSMARVKVSISELAGQPAAPVDPDGVRRPFPDNETSGKVSDQG